LTSCAVLTDWRRLAPGTRAACAALDWLHLLSASVGTGTATTGISTLSLHDALPISADRNLVIFHAVKASLSCRIYVSVCTRSYPDRKSTRLNSSHVKISYAVFCLKNKSRGGAQGAHRGQIVARFGIASGPVEDEGQL